jgi:thiol:disulfide interchange protein DsbD
MSFVVEALVLGILYGIGPCTVFCAPVIVPLIVAFSDGGKDGVKQTFIFSAGRILSYAVLGAVSGLAGSALIGAAPREAIAAVIIGLGVLVLLRRYPQKCGFACKVKGKHASFSSGILLGLAPCYPLIGLLTLAALSNSPVTGMIMGLVFGIGTTVTPLLILGFFAGKWAKLSQEFRGVNVIMTGGFLILVGLSALFF